MKRFAIIILFFIASHLKMFAQVGVSFTLPDMNGKAICLDEFKGKYTIVDFWASWCVPCRKGNQRLEKMYGKYKSRGLEIVAISLDKDTMKWKQALEKDKLSYVQLIDTRATNSPLMASYGFESIPATYLLDKNGKVLQKIIEMDEFEYQLRRLLK